MPIDIMKIDKLFLDGILDDFVTQKIVRSMLAFEFKAVQGYYYSMPVCKKDIVHWLTDQKFNKITMWEASLFLVFYIV